jgi:hypothetical protein
MNIGQLFLLMCLFHRNLLQELVVCHEKEGTDPIAVFPNMADKAREVAAEKSMMILKRMTIV